jgi:thioredoxin
MQVIGVAMAMTIITCPKCGAKNRIDERRATTMQPVCGRCHAKLDVTAPATVSPLEVTDATFAREVLGAGKPVLVDAWAAWCGPCKMIAPTIDQLARESSGRYTVAKLDVDANPRTAAQFNISSIPTLLIFKNGQLVDRLVGLQPKPAIEARLKQVA